MANRYVNCLKESPVSILKEGKFKFKLNAFGIVSANEILSGKSLEIDKDGALCINEGEYILTVDK
jgi:hypothetical protein